MKTARFVVLQLLAKMSHNAFSDVVLNEAFAEGELSEQDKKFAAALFYGVIERELTLDYVVLSYSNKPLAKLDNYVLQILRMGLYQLLFMPSIPESAAVNESVALTKRVHKDSASGFVNAILRGFIRDEKSIKLPDDRLQRLSVEYSCPIWLVKKWLEEYGEIALPALLASTVALPLTAVKVNTITMTAAGLLEIFHSDGLEAEISEILPDCIELKNCGAIERNAAFVAGYFHVQDLSSQLCCRALNPQVGEVVLDLCAAPGGKAFTLTELMNDSGEVFAFDLQEKRVKLIRSGAERLKLSSITALCGDAKVWNDALPLADKVLCDVPCAGLGVIGKKPEIKYKDPETLLGLPEIQYAILENGTKYLKIGGELVYSTCSVSRAENDEVIDRFLRENDGFEGCSFLSELGAPFGDYKATLLPQQIGNCDGFFIAKIRRTK